ncbi:MAG: cation-efflux pump [Candidatus Gracilibacteria bacterium]
MQHEKQSVALSSVFASFGLAGIKFFVGIITGSMGILSEAAHSTLDLGAALLTYFAVKEGDKPADKEHPYGHAKIESISALAETFLLFITSGWIIYEATHKLIVKHTEIQVEWYSYAVIAISIIVDISRSRALMKTAKKTKSQALEADALHFSSDIWSSAVVLVGLLCAQIGYPLADPIAALIVAVFVLFAGIRLGKRTFDVLIDTAPAGMVEKIKEITLSNEHVLNIIKIRVRPAGLVIFVELSLAISRKLALEKLKELNSKIESDIKKEYPEADITIAAEPVALDSETISERIKIIADKMGIPVHDITVHKKGRKKIISFNLEVPHSLVLKDAHDKASSLEEQIKLELGHDLEINTHIEPVSPEASIMEEPTFKEQARINDFFNSLKPLIPDIKDFHEIKITKNRNNFFIDLHCSLDGSLSIEKTHSISDRIEELANQKIHNLKKITIHTEPTE